MGKESKATAYNERFRNTWLAVIFGVIPFLSFGQSIENNSLSDDFEFTLYLLENKLYDDASTLLNRNSILPDSISSLDSLNYLKGWVSYSKKELNDAVSFFDAVSPLSVFYPKSVFFSALSSSHLGDYAQAKSKLISFSDTSFLYKELYAFEMAGIALLERDFSAFDHYSKDFSFQTFYLAQQQKELLSIREAFAKQKKKSMWVAGVSSAIVPGLGKIYTGHLGEGIASFLTVGGFAAITAENWIKAGPANWKTIVFGSLGLIFYIGNIYGSIASVKVYYNEFNQRQVYAILYSIHIPLRTVFN